MSIVEDNLRAQRESWREISERISKISTDELCPERPRRILLFGVGSSRFSAKLAGYAIMRDKLKVRIPVVSCVSTAVGGEVIPAKGDWAFGISHRGKTGVTQKALELCQAAGAFTLMVSAKGTAQPQGVDFVLETTELERVEPHTLGMTGAICAVTSLMLGRKGVEEWDALRSIGDPSLEQMRNRVGEGPSVLLGEWEGEWIAREGALKLMEMARLSPRAYGSEEFFHGPHWAHTDKDKIWHVALPNDPRSDQIKASERLDIYGASPLAWFPALMQMQWLALATALNLGQDPDLLPGVSDQNSHLNKEAE